MDIAYDNNVPPDDEVMKIVKDVQHKECVINPNLDEQYRGYSKQLAERKEEVRANMCLDVVLRMAVPTIPHVSQ